MDSDLTSLKQNKSFDVLIQLLKQQVGRFEVQPEDLEGKDPRSAYFSALYLVIRSLGAKDWFSGLEVSVGHSGKSHALQVHHIFPKALLKGQYQEKVINDMANLAFLGGKANRKISASEPKDYLRSILSERGEEALSKQLVPLDPSLWELSAYPKFLEARRRLIADAINEYLAKL